MVRSGVAVAIGGGALARDAFLEEALRAGAREALWVDAALGWAERYRLSTSARPPRFLRRELLWPGERAWLDA